MSLGMDQNNPTNIIAGIGYQGEVATTNRFAAFSSIPWAVRAWLYNLYTAYDVHGRSTYEEYLSAFAPVEDGNSSTYPSDVVGTDFNLNDTISFTADDLQTLFYDQVKIETGGIVSQDDFNQGLQLFNNSVPGVILQGDQQLASNLSGSGVPSNVPFFIFLILLYVLLFGD